MLKIIPTFETNTEVLRRVVMDKNLMVNFRTYDVKNVVFTIGERNVTVAVGQIEDYDEVIITIDPDTDTYTVKTAAAERTEDLVFTIGEREFTIPAEKLNGTDKIIITHDKTTDTYAIEINGEPFTEAHETI